jgi:tetratricopeptide (TPR) repeat protein
LLCHSDKKITFAPQKTDTRMAKKKSSGDERLVAVEEALGKTERFIERNQKIITYVIMGVIIVVLGYFGYQRFIVNPRNIAAQEQIFTAQKYFETDSLNRALYGDGNAPGFIDIIDDYGRTKSGNLARYYAGICYMKLGDYEEAIRHLEKYEPADKIIGPMALGTLGDAYMELDDMRAAARYYMRAADEEINDFTTPMYLYRAGMTYELLGDYKEALKAYDRIYREFFRSAEARTIERNIARVNRLIEKEKE